MKDALKPLVDTLITSIQNGVNFVTGQIPDVARQIIAFKSAEAVLSIVMWIVLAVFSLLYFPWSVERERDWTPVLTGRAVLSAVGFAAFLIRGLGEIYHAGVTLLQIHYAPKLFLLEFLKEFLR